MQRALIALLGFTFAAGLAPLTAEPVNGPAWHSHRTEHFTFIYRLEHQEAVNELASFADEVYDQVTGYFQSSPSRIPAVVYGESDLANGYYTSAPPQHIGLYVSQPTMPTLDVRAESWLRLLLVHEVTHFVHANHKPGFFDLLGTVFGRTLTGLSLGFTPNWAAEGIAIRTETAFTSGGRGRNPLFEMQYKAPIVEDEMWTLWQSGYDSYASPPGGRYYVGGYFFWDYLTERYGREFTSEFMRNYSAFPFLGIWLPIATTTDEGIGRLYDQAVSDLIRRYADSVSRRAAPRLSPSGVADYHLPVPTERGLYLYRSRPDRVPAIVSYDPERGTEEVLLEMRLTDSASWSASPDGSTIVFATLEVDGRFPDEEAVYSNIFRLDVASGEIRRVTRGGGYHQPVLVPGSNAVIAIAREGSAHALVEIDTVSGERTRTLVTADGLRLYSPSVSPDGSTVVVVANQQGSQGLLLVDLASGEHEAVPTPADGVPFFPTFADDRTLLYGHDRGGELALYRQAIGSGEAVPVAEDPVAAFAGRPHEDELVVASYTSEGYTLRRAPAEPGSAGPAVPADANNDPFVSREAPPPVTGEPWAPIPWPRFWFPTVGLAGQSFNAADLGGGVLTYGADLLQRNSWQLSTVYFPLLNQLDYNVQWTTRYGPYGISALAASTYGYGPDGDGAIHVKVFQQGAQLSYDLVRRYELGVSTTASLALAATHALFFSSASPFAFTDLSDPSVALDTNTLTLRSTVRASRRPSSSLQAFHSPGAITGAFSISTPFLMPEVTPQAVTGRLSGSYNVGIAGSDHVLRISPVATYSSSIDYASAPDLRGFGTATSHAASQSLRGRYRLSLDYHTPHLLVDLPLAPNVGITRMGFTVFVEATGGYDPWPSASGGVALDEAIGLGGEFMPVVYFWQEIPVTFGVATRIRPMQITDYSPLSDIRFYIESDLLQSLPRLPQYLQLE